MFATVDKGRAAAITAKMMVNLPPIPVVKTEPWAHQVRGFWFLWHGLDIGDTAKGGMMLGMDMGTGKTKTVIDLINNADKINTVLVTCPKAVVATWPEEMETHCARPFRVIALPKGPVKKRAAEATKAWGTQPEGCVTVYVINHEAVWREPFRTFVLKRQWDLLVVDECHRAKAPGGRLSKFLHTAGKRFRMRLGLTGTPMPRDHMDLFAQARFIDDTIYGTNYADFMGRYGWWKEIQTGKKDRFGRLIVARKLTGVRNEEQLQGRLDSFCYRVMADDVLDLPPAVVMKRTCELDPKERRVYEDIKRKLVAEIDGGFVTAANGLVKLLRLQQATQGFVRDECEVDHQVGTSKADCLRDVLMDLDNHEPVVVYCRFHSDLDQVARVAEQLERGCLELSGRIDQLEKFKQGGGPIIAVQIDSGGVGVDLSRAAYTVYFSPTYNMGAYEQSLRRTRRPSKHEHATFFYYHLVAENTIDGMIYAALRGKKKIVDHVLAGIRGQK